MALANASSVMDYIHTYDISPLTSAMTTSVLSGWGSSASLLAFTHLNLYAASFVDDAACEALGNLINDATNLTHMDLYAMNAARPISVSMTLTTSPDADDGVITIHEQGDDEAVCYTRSTSRTTYVNIDTVDQ